MGCRHEARPPKAERRALCRMSGRGRGTRSKTMSLSERAGDVDNRRARSVADQAGSSSARKMSIRVAGSSTVDMLGEAAELGLVDRAGDAAVTWAAVTQR